MRRGVFPHDSNEAIQASVAFMDSMHVFYSTALQAHPRFAEFFPEAAQQMAQLRAMRQGPGLLGPDGQPVSLEQQTNIVLQTNGGLN